MKSVNGEPVFRRTAQTPGIKIRLAKTGVVQLVDRETGKWLANVRWRPCGTMYVELADTVRKIIGKDRTS